MTHFFIIIFKPKYINFHFQMIEKKSGFESQFDFILHVSSRRIFLLFAFLIDYFEILMVRYIYFY